jgi:hypothetical protein
MGKTHDHQQKNRSPEETGRAGTARGTTDGTAKKSGAGETFQHNGETQNSQRRERSKNALLTERDWATVKTAAHTAQEEIFR